MDARFYNSEEIDIDRLASDLVQAYVAQGFRAQEVGGRDQIMVQLKKGGDFEAIIGMQAALTLTIQRTMGGVLAMIGQQRWIDKAAVGAVGIVALPILWPLAVTAGVGAIRQASLTNQVLNMVDGLVRQQRPGLNAGPIPSYLLPQVQQQWGPPPSAVVTPAYVPPQIGSSQPSPQAALPPPAPRGLRCAHCNTPYEAGDTFCSGCGRPLTAPKAYCPNCNTELKAGLSFCPKCGASTFSTQSAANQPIPRPAPAQTPLYTPPPPVASTPQITYIPAVPPTPAPPAYEPPRPAPPVYTPPPTPPPTPVYQPPTPVYTPPPAPPKPPEPAYTPPAQLIPQDPVNPPAPQVFYVPSQQPAQAPTPPPKKEETVYYVPSQQPAQQPPSKSQPKVTVVPAKEEPPPPKPRPQKQYYVPSNQALLQPTLPATPAQPDLTQAAQPAQAQAASEVETSDVLWGTLAFNDGQQIELQAEHAIVGRYDHDLGGIQPEVDLARITGADTVSRVHAALEHVGNTYTLTDLNSTNATRINGKRLEPDKATPITDGDTLQFGKITCTFKVA
jgi:hypothetical protein